MNLVALEDLLTSKPQYGYTAKAREAGPARMLRTTDITNAPAGAIDWTAVPRCEIEREDLPKYQLREGDILVSRAGTVGVSHLVRPPVPEDAVFASYLIRLHVDRERVDPAYLYWFMQSPSYWQQIASMSAGVAQLNINATKLRELRLPLVPVEEQRAIVEDIERMLSVVAKASATLENAGSRTHAMRRAVANQLAANTDRRPLSEALAETLRNGKSVKDGDGTKVLRLSALRQGEVNLNDAKRGAWGDTDPDPFLVHEGDFLVSRGNGTLSLVGRGGLVTTEPQATAFPDTMIRVRPDKSVVNPQYLRLVWDSDIVRRQIEGQARTTAGIYKINQAILEETKVPLPDLPTQTRRVEQAEEVLTHLPRLHQVVVTSKKRCVAMQHSILKAAFEGRLTRRAREAQSARELEEAIA